MVFGVFSALRVAVSTVNVVNRASRSSDTNDSRLPYTRFSQPRERSGWCKFLFILVVVVVVGIIVGLVFKFGRHDTATNPDTHADTTNNGNYHPYHPNNGNYHPNNGGIPDQSQPRIPPPDLSKGGKYAYLAYDMKSMMSPRTNPCDDFYKYACGGWIDAHPADGYESHGLFEKAGDEVQDIIHGALDRAVRTSDSEAVKKAKWFFKTCMDTSAIDNLKARPLQELLSVLAFHNFKNVEDTMVQMAMYKTFPIATLRVSPDLKNSDTNIITLDQPSLPLRDLEWQVEGGLRNYMEKVQRLLNRDFYNFNDDFLGDIDSLLDTHKSIADLTTAKKDRLSVDQRYRKYTLGALNSNIPGFDWKRFVTGVLAKSGVNVTDDQPVLVLADGYLRKVGRYLTYANQQEVLKFMRWNFVHHLLPYLSHDYRLAVNELLKAFKVKRKEETRRKTCTTLVDVGMSNITGRLFIDAESIQPEALEVTKKMVDDIRNVFKERMKADSWMDEKTRAKAIEKLDAMGELIGYPPEIKDDAELNKQFQDMSVSQSSFFDNVLALIKRSYLSMLRRLHTPVMKTEWLTGPSTVNAFYQLEKNSIVIPAGILRKPFFSLEYPKSVIYASLGFLVAHEMTHGFDSSGKKYDKDGSLHDWWSSTAASNYRQKEGCYKRQYSTYELPFLIDQYKLLNGTKTLPENIADNGGVKDGFQAYTESMSRNNNSEATLPYLGLTHKQIFYLAFAQRWCENSGEDRALLVAGIDTHSPGPLRVKGTLQNSKHFASVFGCPTSSQMNPPSKCQMW